METGLWLMKTEPEKYAYSNLVSDGVTVWDGVRNNQAALYLKAMKVGDQAFIYHSGAQKAVVGVAKISREAFLDPSDPAGRFVAVEIVPVRALSRPVPLGDLKAREELAGMTMFRLFRLSVTPVTRPEWDTINMMSGA